MLPRCREWFHETLIPRKRMPKRQAGKWLRRFDALWSPTAMATSAFLRRRYSFLCSSRQRPAEAEGTFGMFEHLAGVGSTTPKSRKEKGDPKAAPLDCLALKVFTASRGP
jgi:hypothetical protein